MFKNQQTRKIIISFDKIINVVVERKIGIDLLRAIAILIVIEQHGRSLIVGFLPQIKYLGYTDGVDLFFVLSGFLIGGILIKYLSSGNLGIKTFLIRRWYRTLPNFYFAFTLNLIIYFIFLFPNNINWSLLIKTMFFFQNYYPPFSDFSFFSEAWSLSIEEHFYLTFSLLLFIINKYFVKNSVLSVILIMILVSFITRLLILNLSSINNYTDYNNSVRIITLCRFDSLVIGVFIALIKSKYQKIYNKQIIINILFITGIIICFVFDRTWIMVRGLSTYVILFSSMIYSIGIALLIPFLDNLKIESKLISYPISHIAKISYSMYLYHNSIFLIPIYQISQSSGNREKIYLYLIYWIFVLSISTIAYNIIEKPFLKIRDKKFPDLQNSLA